MLLVSNSLFTTIQQIETYRRADSYFDRHIRARACVMELFIRVAFRGVVEALKGSILLPFAAVKLVLNTINLGRLLPFSANFGQVVYHLKFASRCMTALALDFPAILIDPGKGYSKLLYRQLISTESLQTTPKSLLDRAWNSKFSILLCVTVVSLVSQRLFSMNKPVISKTPKLIVSPITQEEPFLEFIAIICVIMSVAWTLRQGVGEAREVVKNVVLGVWSYLSDESPLAWLDRKCIEWDL